MNCPLAGEALGHDVSKWMDYAIGGWQINAIYALQGGTPFSITSSALPTRLGRLGRQDPSSSGNILDYVDASAFAAPAKNAAGIYLTPHAGRDIVRGPGFSNLDFALSRISGYGTCQRPGSACKPIT